MAASLTLAALAGAPAMADPVGADPTNSSEAKQAWDEAKRQAEVAAEFLNEAREDQAAAQKEAAKAAAGLTAARAKLTAAQRRAADAQAAAAQSQSQLDAFAAASFKGGVRLNDMSAMLTATSADDALDQAAQLSQVADDNSKQLAAASAAKAAAVTAKADAVSAEAAAAQASSSADEATARADRAAAAAKDKKAALDASVTKNKSLYDQLTEKERQEAVEAAAQARAESLARARELAARQAAEAARTTNSAAGTPQAQSPQAEADGGQSTASQAPATQQSTAAEPSTQEPAPSVGGGGDSAGQIAAAAALTKVGAGYCYACNGPGSFDCSGLTTWAWAQAGVSITRTSRGQSGYQYVPLDQLQPGDLVTYYSPVSHVAIYVGNGMVVSAVDESSGVQLRTVRGGGPNPTGHRVPR